MDDMDETDEMSENENTTEREEAIEPEIAGGSESEAGETAAAGDVDGTAALKARVEELEKANAELKDQLLRRVADFDNYRKRAIQEKQDAFDYANTNLIKDLLESLDNFERTVEAAKTAQDAKSIADGVSMIARGLVSLLENKYELASYGAAGDAFDPELHEAIGSSEGEGDVAVVSAVYLKGYKLRGKVIRHAKVMVAMPKAQSAQQAQGGGTAEAPV